MSATPSNPAVPKFLKQVDEPPSASFGKSRSPLTALLVAVCLMAAGLAASWYVSGLRQTELETNLSRRASVVLGGRIDVLETWLSGAETHTAPIREGDVFRLFATEMAVAQSGQISESMAAQLRYLQSAFDDVVRRSGIVEAWMIGPDGTAWMATSNAASPTDEQRAAARKSITDTARMLPPARANEAGELVVDVSMPVLPLQSEGGQSQSTPVAALLISLPANDLFSRLVAPDPLARNWEHIRLFQADQDAIQEIRPKADDKRITESDLKAPIGAEFSTRPRAGGGGEVLSLGRPVPNTPWSLLFEAESDRALASLTETRIVGALVALLFATIGGIAVLASSWRQASADHRTLVRQYQDFASQLSAQRRFIDAINDSVQEWLFATDREGRLVYANSAFCGAVGSKADAIVGLPLGAVIEDAETVKTLRLHDGQVADGRSVNWFTTTAIIGDEERWLSLSKSPLTDEFGEPAGVVTVTRDVTEERRQRFRREHAIKSTVRALSRTVEVADPHLADHANKLEAAVLSVARDMGLDEDACSTLEMAANLSQIGKLFVPRELLTRPERLNPEERKLVAGHVDYAIDLLSEIDFDLPVLETLSQMNELIDGSGYPKGLKGEQIGILGRVLAVCDVFVARTSARSYRGSTKPADILEILERFPERYAPEVVAVLRGLFGPDAETETDA